MTRILIAAADPALRCALNVALRTRLPVAIVGEAADRPSLRHALAALQPDLVLIDWALPEFQSLDDLAGWVQASPSASFVAVSVRAEDAPAVLGAGASGYVQKGDLPEELIAALSRYVQ